MPFFLPEEHGILEAILGTASHTLSKSGKPITVRAESITLLVRNTFR